MAKYIIDIPDDTTYINALKYEDNKCVAAMSYVIPDLIPYTEPDRKAVENEVWDFATSCIDMDGNDFCRCFEYDSVYCLTEYTYSEAKSKYDAWKKQEEEIHVGDEVQYSLAGYEYTFIVFGKENDVLYGMRTDKEDMDYTCEAWDYCNKSDSTLEKTGRHFPEVAELLKKMGEE